MPPVRFRGCQPVPESGPVALSGSGAAALTPGVCGGLSPQEKYKDAAISIRKPVGNTGTDGRGESSTHRLGGAAMR